MKLTNGDYLYRMDLKTDLIQFKEDLLKKEPAELKTLMLSALLRNGVPNSDAHPIVDGLSKTDYFTAPASKGHHGAQPKCLFVHSYMVGAMLLYWTGIGAMSWTREQSPIIVGTLHDLCKHDSYKPVYGELDISDPEWPEPGEIIGYKYNEDQFPLGHHGLASLVYANGLYNLTEEEMLCIRWHMGSYEKDQWDNYGKAIKMYTNVLWTHNADMFVSKVLGV